MLTRFDNGGTIDSEISLLCSRTSNHVNNFLIPEDKFNCWGFTAYCLGNINYLTWLGSSKILEILRDDYFEIPYSKIDKYDVLAQYGYRNHLLHTCFFIDNDTVLSKNGSEPLQIYTLDKICKIYSYNCRFFRLLDKQLLEDCHDARD